MQNEKTCSRRKEQGKNPPDQTNEEEIGSLPEKEGIQSNDSKDDPKSWKQNGENARNI